MSHADTLERMGQLRVGAIIRADSAEVAAGAMRAAVKGGFRIIEFTLTTPDAFRLIADFAADTDLLVGAGTVLTVEQVRKARDHGAQFIVSPVVDADVITAARSMDLVTVPGTATPTEMVAADRAGADLVKVFPAPADIPTFVRQVRGPLPHLRIYPTAGVTPENFQACLAAGAFGVGFVSSLFTPANLESRDYESIRRRAANITALV